MRVLLDSNILIDHLRGIPAAAETIARYPAAAISIVSWIEVMSMGPASTPLERLRSFLARFDLVDLDSDVAELAAELRREKRLKLADAAILASAKVGRRKLVTRNTRDFKPDWPEVIVPYELVPPK